MREGKRKRLSFAGEGTPERTTTSLKEWAGKTIICKYPCLFLPELWAGNVSVHNPSPAQVWGLDLHYLGFTPRK